MGNSSSTKGSGSHDNSVQISKYGTGGARPPQNPQSSQLPETLEEEELSRQLLKACLNGELDEVKGLLSQGATVSPVEVLDPLSYANAPSSPTSSSVAKRNFISPLIAAITGAQLEVVQHLVSAGCSINQSFQQYSESNGSVVTGVTPIMLACQRKHKGVIAFLLAAKADCSAVDSDKNTILHYVCRHQQQPQRQQVSLGSTSHGNDRAEGDDITDTLQLLQDFQVLSSDIPCCSNIRNNTPLHSLAYFNNYAAMLLLLEVTYGASPGASGAASAQYKQDDKHFVNFPPPSPSQSTLLKNDVGMTPLHIAVLRKAPRMVRLLLDFAFDPGVQERSGLDAFQLARVVSIQQSTKDISGEEFVNCKAVIAELEAYSSALEERQVVESVQESSVLEEVESLECDLNINASSITFDNTVDEVDEKGTESTSSLKDDYYFRQDFTRAASLTEHMVGSGAPPRQVHPFPTASKVSKHQLLGAAHDILSGERMSPRSGKKKKKIKKRTKSPTKRQISPQKSRQYSGKGAPFLCGIQPRSTSPRKTPATSSPRRAVSNNSNSSAVNSRGGSSRVTPAKHSRTAHSSIVHRGETAANMLSSSRHMRARAGWPTTPRGRTTKVTPSSSSAQSAQRSHRGAKQSRSRAAAPTASAASSAAAMKLPAHIHTSPSGILTITFS